MATKWVFCAKIPVDDGSSDANAGSFEVENPIADPATDDDAPKTEKASGGNQKKGNKGGKKKGGGKKGGGKKGASKQEDGTAAEDSAAPPVDPTPAQAETKAPPKSSKKKKQSAKNPVVSQSMDLLYTNTGAVDIVLASDEAGTTTWIKEVKSSRLQPGMRLVSMDVFDREKQRMATRDFASTPFLDVVKEVEAQSVNGTEGGISPFHLKFDPDPLCPPVDELANAKLVRMEAKYEKEVIDVLEAIDRGTANGASLNAQRDERYERVKAQLALSEANVRKLQSSLVSMERSNQQRARKTEDDLRRSRVAEREQADANAECRQQLAALDRSFAKATGDLRAMQAKNEELGKEFATQAGQLEASRKREVVAHQAQADLAQRLTTGLEQGDEAEQLKEQFKTMQAQKQADDQEIEAKTAQLAEMNAIAQAAGQREETTRLELTAKIEQLESVIAGLNRASERQREVQRQASEVALSNQEAADAQIASLQEEIGGWEIKYNTLREQHAKLKAVCSLATTEIQDLKDQRQQVQQELAQQLTEQEEASAQAAAEAAKLQKLIDVSAAELANQEKMAKQDVKKAQDTDKFFQKQLQQTVADKIKQVEVLNDLVKQLQTELAKQRQLRSEQEAEVARVNKTLASDGKTIAALKEDTAGYKHKVWEKGEECKKQAAEIAQLKAKAEEISSQMQQQTNDQQTQLDDERSRASQSEQMRIDSEQKAKASEKALLEARRKLDDLTGQHNKALSQILTLERRAQAQNDAAAAQIEAIQSQLADKTKMQAVDEAEIDKLKDDYKFIHNFLTGCLEDLRKCRLELGENKKRIDYQDAELSTAKTQNAKALADLKDALKAAQENEKQSSSKVATLGSELLKAKDECKKQALSAQTYADTASNLQTKLSLVDAARKKAEERVGQFELAESQSNVKVSAGLREVAGLEEELASMRQARDALRKQLQATTADLRNEQKLHKVTKSDLGAAGASLAVALAIQPALDETMRKLEKTEKELAHVKETTVAAAAAAAAAAATALENEKRKAAEEFSTMKESLTTELNTVKATLSSEHATTRDDLSQKLSETEERSASEFETMKTSLTTELAETKAKMAADHKATTDDLTAKIQDIEERAASELAATKADAAKTLAETKTTLAAQQQKAEDQWKADLENTKKSMAEEHQATKDELVQTKSDLEEALANAKASAAAELEQTKATMGTELKLAEEKWAADLKGQADKLNGEHQATKDRLETELAETKRALEEEHANSSETMSKQAEAQIAALKDELQKTKEVADGASQQAKEALDSKKKLTDTLAADEKAMELVADTKEKLKQQRDQIKALTARAESLQAALEKEKQLRGKETAAAEAAKAKASAAAEAAQAKAGAAADKKFAEYQRTAEAKYTKLEQTAEGAKVNAQERADARYKKLEADSAASLAATRKDAEQKFDAFKKNAEAELAALDKRFEKFRADSEATLAQTKTDAEARFSEMKSRLESNLATAQQSADAKLKTTTETYEATIAEAKKATDLAYKKLQNESAAQRDTLQQQADAKYAKLQADSDRFKDIAKKQSDVAYNKLKTDSEAATTAAKEAADKKYDALFQQTEAAKAAAKAASDDALSKQAAAAAAAASAAQKTTDDLLAKAHAEAQKLAEALAAAKSAEDDANKTIAARDAELKGQAEKAAADAADAEKALKDAELEKEKTVAEYEKKLGELEAAAQSIQDKLNTSEAEVATTKGLLQAETEAKAQAEQKADDIAAQLAVEVQGHEETKEHADLAERSANISITRYAQEKWRDLAEREGLEEQLRDMEREKGRIYARLAETQMVLLAKDKALQDSMAAHRKYRLIASAKGARIFAEKKVEAEQLRTTLQEDIEQKEAELQNVRSEKLQAERQVSDQAMQLTAKETELQTAAKAKKELEAKLSESEEMCAVWRAKARHRHRALEMPRFSNDKGGKQQKEQWLKDRALSETLGIDADNDKELTVTIDAPPPVGLGLLNAKDNSGQNFTVIHSIKEGSPADLLPLVAQGQVIVSINDEDMSGKGVQDVMEELHHADRPMTLTLKPGSMELQLLAYQDHMHTPGERKKKKGKKKS